MKKIVITGATSFIGFHLIEKIVKEDVKIYAVVRKGSNKIVNLPKDKKIIIVEADMKDYRSLSEKIRERCDIFYALSWNGTRGKARMNMEKQRENFEYSLDSVKVAHELGCSRFVSAGSQAEYGSIQGIIKEDIQPLPNTEYGKWKYQFFLDAYRYCRENSIQFIEPRFFSLYGVGDFEGTLIMSILQKMKQDKLCELTECVQKWNFLYIDDAIDAIIKLSYGNHAEGVYNLGSGDTRTLKDFIQEMAEITKTKSELKYGAIPYSNEGVVSIIPDITKLKQEIQFVPQINFRQGIIKILDSLK